MAGGPFLMRFYFLLIACAIKAKQIAHKKGKRVALATQLS